MVICIGLAMGRLLVFLMDHDEHWILYGKTEWQKDKTSAVFDTPVTIPIDDEFKEVKIQAWDLDKFKPDQIDVMSNHDLIGTVTINIRKLVDKPEYSTALYNSKLSGDAGQLTISSTRV